MFFIGNGFNHLAGQKTNKGENDWATTIINFADIAFDGADNLWHNVQWHILDFCDTHQGDAFMAEEKISRPKWNKVKEFLKGEISLQQYKADLHCP